MVLLTQRINLLSQEFRYYNIRPVESINSEFDDFAPCFDKYREVLYINSVREGYSYFYSSPFNNNEFGICSKLKGDINCTNKNQSYISLINEDQAYYSAYSLKGDRSYYNIWGIYYKKGVWTNPVLLDSISEDNYSAQATVNPTGDCMVFSSTRTDNDCDLWISYRQNNGTWGEIMPFSIVNSPGDEITPFLKSQDTLFFASNGLGGPGGFDLYQTIRIDGVWQRPFPVLDLNSEFDESDFTMINDSVSLFSSNRPGGLGGLDIYRCDVSKNIPINIEDTEFDLALSSPIHLVKIDKIINCEYKVFPGTDSISKIQNIERRFSPESMDLLVIVKPDGSFLQSKIEIWSEDNLLYNSQLYKSIDNINLVFNDLLNTEYDAKSPLTVKASAISKANFSIDKELEISFVQKEIVNNRPYRIMNSQYGLISIAPDSISSESIIGIIRTLIEEDAQRILIVYDDLLNIQVNKLAQKIKSKFSNLKLSAEKKTNNTDSIRIYFQ